MIDDNFIRDRITELRMQKNVSEYKMSLDMGHSRELFEIRERAFPERHSVKIRVILRPRRVAGRQVESAESGERSQK